MEHDLAVAERLVQRLDARLTELRVQTSTVPGHYNLKIQKLFIFKIKNDKLEQVHVKDFAHSTCCVYIKAPTYSDGQD